MSLVKLVLFLFPSALIAQSVSVTPDHFLAQRNAGIAPCPVFDISAKGNSLFGKGKQPKFKLPNTTGAQGFAFASCPFTPAEYRLDERTLIYFTHIGQTDMQAYVDRNFNYDYTDDGPPVMAEADSSVTIAFASSSDPSMNISIRFGPLVNKMNVEKFPLEILSQSPYYAGVNFIDRTAWLYSYQFWIKGKNVVIGKDSMCVAFFDSNINGCFTDRGDMIALLPYGEDSAYTMKYYGDRELSPGLVMGFNGHAYEIECDTAACRPVSIIPRPDLAPPVALVVGDQLPHFSFAQFNGDSTDIYSIMQKGKYTYIDFWGVWCAGCRLSIPSLIALHDSSAEKLTIISLDAYDERSKARTYVQEHQMNWINGFSNSEIEKMLYAGDAFPFGILVDPSGRILAFDVYPTKVKAMISGGQ